MNPSDITSLKILVEMAVRPIRAGMHRKMQLREQLLDRLINTFEREAKISDERVALECAKQRFGNPADVTHNLQKSVGMSDQIWWFLERQIASRAGEPSIYLAFRHIVLCSFFYLPLHLLFIYLVLPGWANSAFLMSAVLNLVIIAIFIFLAHAMWSTMYANVKTYWPQAAVCLATASLFGPGILLLLSCIVSADERQRMIFSMITFVPSLMIATPYALVFSLNMMWRRRHGPIRDLTRILAVDIIQGLLVSSVTFLISLVISADVATSLENAVAIASLTIWWLMPMDLIFSGPWVVATVRANLDWNDLRVDGGNVEPT